MSRLRKILAERGGEGYIDVAVLILCVMLVLALSVKILPVFIAKQQLDTFATELCREAEIAGRIGSETNRRAAVLREKRQDLIPRSIGQPVVGFSSMRK